jgi:hypothetical protein
MNARMTIKSFIPFLAALIASIGICTTAIEASTEAQAKRIESVLDRLEKRLIDKESAPLTSEEAERVAADVKSPVNSSQKTDQKYVPKSAARIKGQTQTGRNIQELQKKINEYDSRIEILESDLRKIRSNVQDNAITDNVVSLQIKTDSKNPVVMKTLSAVLDGNTIYSQIDPAGVWIPSKIIPLYFGPLKPGAHKLELTATISSSTDESNAAGSWKQKALLQSFDFSIPEGKQRKSITIEIGKSKSEDASPTATLFESEVK